MHILSGKRDHKKANLDYESETYKGEATLTGWGFINTNMTIFRKNSTTMPRKKSVEVKFKIEEGSELEKMVSKKISEIKETFSHSAGNVKEANIFHGKAVNVRMARCFHRK